MIRASTFAGKTVAVFGLGASGLATVRSLISGGATVAAWDDGQGVREAAATVNVPLVDLRHADWSVYAALVLAPGVPLTHPEPHWTVALARAAGVEVIGDIEIFARERRAHCPHSPFLAITGTNGKSTTTALITHILRSAGLDAQMGGNIGKAILTLDPPAPGRVHVIEMSSFQIDLTPSLAPSIGVLLNMSADHLDRHGPADDAGLAMRNYAAIKQRLVMAADHAIIGVDDAWSSRIDRDRHATGRSHEQISAGGVVATGVRAEKGQLLRVVAEGADGKSHETVVAGIADIPTLRGQHNQQNAAAACAAARHLGVATDVLGAALASYPGLPHRMEVVGTLGKVLVVNDSKATNADSTEKALASWERGIFWILGGKAKDGGIRSLEPYFPRVAKAYLIGAAADVFAVTLDGKVAYERSVTLDVALTHAARDAARSSDAEPVVLLSPACASYDQFRSFEHRGDTFRELFGALAAAAGEGAA